MNSRLYILILLVVFNSAYAQEESINAIETDSIPDLQVELENTKKKDKKKKKRKAKKKVYYGKKVRKSFVKNGSYIEIFHYLKEFEAPNKYIENIAWFYPQKRAIYETNYKKVKKGSARILHGPYERRRGDKVVERGFYYIGAKHGRWEKYGRDAMDRDHILLDKTTYFRGWQKDSERTYFDTEQKKLKEVIPIKYGKRDGMYYRYYKNGFLAEKGAYENDQKVGRWMEYYSSGQRKREIQHPKNALVENVEPYTLREWNTKGKVTEYERSGRY
ncbi:MAG: toxin-antitoxin system YwqK family antitoxin [Thermonemataceae bacterium]